MAKTMNAYRNYGKCYKISNTFGLPKRPRQGSKIALVRLYLRVPQAAGQVKILIFLVKINFSPIFANNFCDTGQVPILRYFEYKQHKPRSDYCF